MAGNKWNIGSVNVQGQAMFGDNNEIKVVVSSQDLAGLNVPDQAAVAEAFSRLRQVIQADPVQERESLSSGNKAELQQVLHQILDELKKPHESQNTGFVRQCVDKMLEAAKAVPLLVKAALEVKSVLGF